MEKSHFTVETLERELRAFEERYGLSSDELVRLYRAGSVPARVPRHDAFVWASTWRHAAQLRDVPQPA